MRRRRDRRDESRNRPYRDAGRQHAMAAEAIGHPSAEELRPQVAPEESRQHEALRGGVVTDWWASGIIATEMLTRST